MGKIFTTRVDALIIGGHFSNEREDTIHHVDDFRLHCDGVPMSIPHLNEYFKNGRRFTDAPRRSIRERYRPYRQLYYSALHIYNLLQREGFEVRLLNCHYREDPTRLKLYQEEPRCVIISTTYMNMDAVRTVVNDIREYLPHSIIIAGGNYVRHSYLVWQKRNEPYYRDPEVLNRYFFTTSNPIAEIDAFIYDAHGEKTLITLMKTVTQSGNLHHLPNTIFYQDHKLVVNREEPEEFSMDDYHLSWKKVPRELLSTVVPFSMTYGCRFNCGFCNFTQVPIAEKSMDVAFQELRDIAELGIVQKIWFTDDNFFLTPSKVEKFCQRFIDEGLPFSWMSFIRASSITPRTVALMKKSNVELLVLGLESGSPTVLRAMNKRDKVSHYYRAMSLLLTNDIDTEISFVFGYPGETDDTVHETIDFINSLPYSTTPLSYLYLFKFNLVPLSPIFEKDARSRWDLQGNFLTYRHKTMASEHVDSVMRRVAIETVYPVFNYLDGVTQVNKQELVRTMRTRDTLARALLANRSSATIEALWNELESHTSALFLR